MPGENRTRTLNTNTASAMSRAGYLSSSIKCICMIASFKKEKEKDDKKC